MTFVDDHSSVSTVYNVNNSILSPMSTNATYLSVETTVGSLVLELYTHHAPAACDWFLTSAIRHGGFLRETPVQMDQPEPNAWLFFPSSDTSAPTSALPVATGTGLHFTGAGVIGLVGNATSDPAASFLPGRPGVLITLAPQPHLDAIVPVIGRVFRGMKVVQAMADMPADQFGKDVRILSISRHVAP